MLFWKSHGPDVNLTKTKIMVLRRGGPLRNNEEWYFDSRKIEIVSTYKYLGLIMSSTLCWARTVTTLTTQASKASFVLKSICQVRIA